MMMMMMMMMMRVLLSKALNLLLLFFGREGVWPFNRLSLYWKIFHLKEEERGILNTKLKPVQKPNVPPKFSRFSCA